MNTPLTFDYFAPKGEEANKKYPAIFLLHGMGSNEKDLPGLVADLDEPCHVFSIRGPFTQAPGYAFFTIEEFGKPDRDVFDKIAIQIKLFIAEAINNYSIAEDKVFLLGFSQGAILAQTLTLVLGNEELAGAVILSGYLPEHVRNEYAKRSIVGMPLLITHGQMDYVLPFHWGEASRDFFKEQNAAVNFMPFDDGHGVTPAVHQEILRFLSHHMRLA